MDACPSELTRVRFLSGAASEDTLATLERHQEECPACRPWFRAAGADGGHGAV